MMITIHVDGMHCGGCVKAVEAALRTLDGVRHVEVDLANASAEVEAQEGSSPAAMIAALDDAGYEARIADRAG